MEKHLQKFDDFVDEMVHGLNSEWHKRTRSGLDIEDLDDLNDLLSDFFKERDHLDHFKGKE